LCFLLESVDDGKSWCHYSYLGYDPTRSKETTRFPAMDEPAFTQLPSGKILMMARPFMHKWVSLDRGRTWKAEPSTLTRTKDKKSETAGLCPSMLCTKAGPPTGTLALVYHDRWGEHEKKGGNYISFSHDEGETWGYPVFIDGGAYPCLYELEKDSGKLLCGYYRDSTLLKAAFFSIPFPTGLRATPTTPNTGDAGQSCITVEWDTYKGKDRDKYEYHVYRSTKDGVSLKESKLIFSGKNVSSYEDQTVENNQMYYYRVTASVDGKATNQSWQASAMIKPINAGF